MKIPILFLDRENLTDRETVDGPVAVRLAGRNEKHLFARSHRLRLDALVKKAQKPSGIRRRKIAAIALCGN